MKKIINKSIIALSFICLAFSSSCSNWLDVQPKTSINEELIYSKEDGFKEALTGAYMLLAAEALYGEQMSYGLVDGLAQRYRAYEANIDYTDPTYYTFPSDMHTSLIDAIWSKGYNLMANINNLISWLDKNSDVITTEGLADIIRGEAIAMRAFVHFDMLRLWGPIYKEDPDAKSIMYRTVFNDENQTLEPASDIVDKVIADLNEALILLENDPMHIDFSGYNTAVYEDCPFLSHRIKRLNRDAVKALLARVYMYKGDKTNAMKYAWEVINAKTDEGNNRYTLVLDNSNDRCFSTEIIFSIHKNDFTETAEDEFMLSNWSDYCSFDHDHIDEIFNITTDGINDIRYREGLGFATSTSGMICLKYNPTLSMYSEVTRNTIPIIRLPEMYYIVAECTTDLAEAQSILTMIRNVRGTDDEKPITTEEERIKALELEYRKEFYAEGQLWYFYKRHFYKTFVGYELEDELKEENYIFAIPEAEVSLGTIN